MKLKHTYGLWACVAGAGEGLGAAFAKGLARRGFYLLLIDKDREKLAALEEELGASGELEVISLCLDLEDQTAVARIMEKIEEANCRYLIYNAAYGPVRTFLSNTPEELDRHIQVNMATPLQLVHRFAGLHRGRRAGILLLSSLAGWRGSRLVAPYAATKAFTWNLAEGLYYEFRGADLDVNVCCPGPVDTPNYRGTRPRQSWISPKAAAPEAVAEYALRHFGRRLFLFPGWSNRLTHFLLNRMLPRRWASGMHNAIMKHLYDRATPA